MRGLGVLLVLLWVLPRPAAAARVYGQGSGLPSLSVTAFARDRDGAMWIGTEDGLVRFDGHRMLPVTLDVAGELADATVASLLAVDGSVVVATQRRLLRVALDGVSVRELTLAGQPLAGVVAMASGGSGDWFAATADGQLLRWPSAGWSDDPLPLLDAGGSPPRSFTDLTIGPSGLWLAALDGAWRVDPVTFAITPVRVAEPGLDDGARHARAVAEFPAGTLWIGYWNDALLRLDLASGAHRWYRPGSGEAGPLRSTSIYTLAAASDRLYIGNNRGLLVYRADCDCMSGLNLPRWDAVDGSGVIVQSLLRDGDRLWAGVFGEGAVLFGNNDEVFHNQVKVDGRDDRLAQTMVRALALDSHHRLWIASYGGGLQFSDPGLRVAGEAWPLQTLQWPAARIEERYLWSIDDAPDGLWLGTGAGLLHWQDGRMRRLDPRVESVRRSLRRADGRRYVGAQAGLFRLVDGQLLQMDLGIGAAPSVVWTLAERGSELWVGGGFGLLRLDAADRVIARYPVGLAADAVPGAVLAQRVAADGRIWLGTVGGLVEASVDQAGPGLAFATPAALRRQRLRSIGSIEEDVQGKLWLGSSSGLWRFDPAAGAAALTRFDHRDGLFGDSFSIGASASDGRLLYFGGSGGLVAFDPLQLKPRAEQLWPRLTRLRLGQSPWMRVRQLALPADHEALRLEFAAGEFADSDQLRYSIRWSDTGVATELGEAASTLVERLPGGRHALQLTAVLLDQPGSARTATVLVVDVAFPWNHTWWGRCLIAALVLALGYFTLLWRTRSIHQQRRLLEAEVQRRTEQLQAASAALSRSNEQLRVMAQTDPLTGLANRRRVFEQAALWQAEGRVLAVLMIDIDHFKALNDRYGHASGDRVLQAFAQLLLQVPASSMLCARYGGEEFLCLFAEIDRAGLERTTADLLQRVREHAPCADDGRPVHYTISAGLALALPDEAFDHTIRRADRALYAAKQQRDGWRWAEQAQEWNR